MLMAVGCSAVAIAYPLLRRTAPVSLTLLKTPIVADSLTNQLTRGQLLMVDSRKRSGLILLKPFHAEFAGPGAAVGGLFDQSCLQAIPVGNLSLIEPDSSDDRQKAYLIRRQWIRLTQQITDNPEPAERVRMILNQFENYFDLRTVNGLPDEVFALLVGVLPPTVRSVRGRSSGV